MNRRDAELLAASSLFEVDYYAGEAGMEFHSPEEAARHYLDIGYAKKINPSTRFDPSFYLDANPDVAAAGVNPLLHFIVDGQKEGRGALLSRSPRARRPIAPPDAAWLDLARQTRSAERVADTAAPVDIIVPVYRGYDDTLTCIHSVLLARNATPYRLIVIDDHSPEPELSRKLVELAELGLIQLLRNEVNLGFVGTVNRGMRLNPASDVILLNSDTVVYNDWIDRLRAHAHGSDRVATVTPYSNNATIFSYPYTLRSNNQRLDIDFAELDRLASVVNAGKSTTIPTGVGFCFYIRRAALDEIGLFDEELFGKGYGEENDFCMRAIEHDWSNVAAFDVFVRHTGEVSFAAGASESKREGYRRLLAAHPSYDALIAACIRRDPMKPGRQRIDVARFARLSRRQGVLMVEHGWGGGIERHVRDLVGLLEADGVPALVCIAARDGGRHRLARPVDDDYPNLPTIDWNDVEETAALLRDLDLRHVHLHSLVAFTDVEIRNMLRAIRVAGLEYDYTLHDYTPICPRVTMIDWGGSYCDTPSHAYCRTCVERDGSPFGHVDVDAWIGLYREVLDGARRIISPAADVAERLRGRVSNGILVRPHPAVYAPLAEAPHERTARPVRTIGLIGAIGPHKGSRLLRAMSEDATARKLPLRFIVYGYTDFQDVEAFPNLTVTGAYDDDRFAEVFERNPSDLALFASVWPETFCYSLDHAFNNRIFPVAFALGAPAERIRATGFGRTLALDLLFQPSALNDLLLTLETPLPRGPVIEEGRAWMSPHHYYDLAQPA